jgi:hypothetical protein
MSAPTAREIIRGIRHADEGWDAASYLQAIWSTFRSGQVLAERVEAVLALHVEGTPERWGICSGCGSNWPCVTVRALNGEGSAIAPEVK